MAREIVVSWVGRKRSGIDALCSDYAGRIAKVSKVRDMVLKPASGPDGVRIEKEGATLLSSIPDPSYLVVLDRRGKSLSSLEFSRKLSKLREEWPHPLVFAIGSDLGLSREVLDASRWRLSFGPMTMPHELARLVLYEQIYRALAIQQGIKYHRVPLDGH